MLQRLKTIDLFAKSKREREAYLDTLHAIVVGSDQVWRGGYADVEQQLLAYTGERDIIRMSYAASFGGDKLIRYSRSLEKRSAELATTFRAISVREESGIDLCRTHWGVKAQHHVDPTLLFEADHYRSLIRQSPAPLKPVQGGLFAYVLDRSEATSQLTSRIASRLGIPSFEVLPPSAKEKNAFANNPSVYRMAPLEQWLHSFAESDFVVTDSFHGTVFSILFNKPFIAIGNRARGLARFDSLLSFAGLADRLYDRSQEIEDLPLSAPDWEDVNARVTTGRLAGWDYLRRHLDSGKVCP
ncbi:polysaccharide pyruvyl transferase family protein [Tessaracoccus sp. Y36]